MSRLGLVSLLLAGVCFVIVVIARVILGGWLGILWAPLLIGLSGLVSLLFLEFKTILEFLTMRTTKNGMNMGAVIAMALVILGSANFISVKYDKSFDFTEEKINSLSDQSSTIVDGLDDTLTFQVFYKGEEAAAERDRMKGNLNLFEKYSSNVESRYYNTFIENLRSQQYLNSLPDKDSAKVFVFVEYKGKKIRVEDPVFAEEKLTSAIVKATRTETKMIYFLSNHGERGLENEEQDGLSGLVQALKDNSFEVMPLDIVKEGQIPDDASVVAIVGPRLALLDQEREILLGYAEKGGRLFVAADPGEKHSIALLTKPLGVEYKNNFILSPFAQQLGGSVATAIGASYSATSDITSKFQSGTMTVFHLSSEVIAAQGSAFELEDLASTHQISFAVNQLEDLQGGMSIDTEKQRSFSVGVSSKGIYTKLDSQEGKKQEGAEFQAVVFGDSDFMTNRGMIQGLNRDLALNSFAYLADQKDNITIRPKQLRGTKVDLTYMAQRSIVIGGISLPLSMFVLSSILWFRRRGS